MLVSAGFARTRRASRGGPTLHFWLDPKTADAITAAIVKTFSEVDPQNKKYYEDNRRNFLSRLNSKIEEWSARLAPLRKEPLVAFHDDWDYFANRFELNIVDFITARDRAPPKLGRIGELTKLMKDKNVRIIISEANQPDRHANMLSERTGAKIALLAGTRRHAAEHGRLHLAVRRQCECAGDALREEVEGPSASANGIWASFRGDERIPTSRHRARA